MVAPFSLGVAVVPQRVGSGLLGWVNERRSHLGAPTDADDIAVEDSLRDRLGPERLASELAAGAALAREEAIDLALERSDSATPG